MAKKPFNKKHRSLAAKQHQKNGAVPQDADLGPVADGLSDAEIDALLGQADPNDVTEADNWTGDDDSTEQDQQ